MRLCVLANSGSYLYYAIRRGLKHKECERFTSTSPRKEQNPLASSAEKIGDASTGVKPGINLQGAGSRNSELRVSMINRRTDPLS